MPTDIAARLHARIAVETRAPAGAPAATITTLPTRRHRELPRWLPAAAALIVIAGVSGTFVLQHSGSPRSGGTDRIASPGGAANGAARVTSPAQVTHSGTVIDDATALDQHVRDLLGGGPVASTSDGMVGGTSQQLATGGTSGGTSGTSKSGTSLLAPQSTGRPQAPDLVGGLSGGLAACLRSLDPDHPALAVDQVVFRGRPAITVVFTGENSSSASVFVIGPACGAAPPDGVLLYREVGLR